MSRLHRSVQRIFVADIVSGRMPVGARLPTETELAQRFEVSRGVARESLRSLEERGLVTVKHGIGATVRPSMYWDMFSPEVIAAVLEHQGGTKLLGDYLECRRLLEIEAAGLAAQRATADDLMALSAALERMTATAVEAPGSPSAEERFHEADVAFHRALIQATGNRALGRMTEPVHRALEAARRPLARPEHRLERSLPEHREILAAVAARDPDRARGAMRAHLLTVERYLAEYAAGTATDAADDTRERAS
jgi:GntR family transcriptional repressor for pyruvate dehydrogenase complex